MGFGTSIFLTAVGAILRFAVNVSTRGVNIHTIGVILMIVGAVGILLSVVWMALAADRRRGVATADVRQVPVVRERELPY
jgi:uncharacterized membrane protein